MLIREKLCEFSVVKSTLKFEIEIYSDFEICEICFNLDDRTYNCNFDTGVDRRGVGLTRVSFINRISELTCLPASLNIKITHNSCKLIEIPLEVSIADETSIFCSEQKLTQNNQVFIIRGWSPVNNELNKIVGMSSLGRQFIVHRTVRKDVLKNFPLIDNYYCGWEVRLTKDLVSPAINIPHYIFLYFEKGNSLLVTVKLDDKLLKQLRPCGINEVELTPSVERFKNLDSNKDVFNTIYKEELWSNTTLSGPGSEGHVLEKSIQLAKSVIENLDKKCVIDLGCGGFYFGRRIIENCHQYLGVDVSSEIIHLNQKNFPSVDFIELDAANEPLPSCDLVVIRQVFQHLPNKDIVNIIENIKNTGCKELLVFEDVPEFAYTPNIDLQFSQASTRKLFDSGVDLEQPPFSLSIERKERYRLTEGRVMEMSLITFN
ncbi:class I SAM-dependent methyltransferase [Aliiglaciecola aliphaticivorans]